MGQYWIPVNLDRREFIMPHKLGSGLKLWEQIANDPGVGAALVILTAAMPEPRGGGDFDLTENWHGPERTFPEHNATPGPMPDVYATIAARTIGRWAGNRIANIGDYAEAGDIRAANKGRGIFADDDLPESVIYALCCDPSEKLDAAWIKEILSKHPNLTPAQLTPFTDVTDDVARVIEHELGGKYVGDGWRHFEKEKQPA